MPCPTNPNHAGFVLREPGLPQPAGIPSSYFGWMVIICLLSRTDDDGTIAAGLAVPSGVKIPADITEDME